MGWIGWILRGGGGGGGLIGGWKGKEGGREWIRNGLV